MPINAAWHRKHPMPKNPSEAERIAWHRAHARHCACRPVPPKLRALLARAEAAAEPTPGPGLAERFVHGDAVRHLVRDLLGCGCPEEVFDDVLVAFPARLEHASLPGSAKIVVGGRLVVLLIAADTLLDLEQDARVILERSRAMRDACGLNRVRLVLVGAVPARSATRLQAAARRLDARTHVHVLPAESLA
jgi:hypothetical protein